MAVFHGTAFFVSEKGHLLTNEHVGMDTKISYQGNEYDTELIASDKKLDLALLKANLENKSYIDFSDDEPIKMQKIYVGGYPLGKGLSDDLKVTSGIVSFLKVLSTTQMKSKLMQQLILETVVVQ